MALNRLFVSETLATNLELQLGEEQSHYVSRVLRLRVGDCIAVFNGDDGQFDATIVNTAKTSTLISVGEYAETDTESPLKAHLVQGISRGERMDFVVQKATELGVKRVSPVLTDYGVVKLDAERTNRRCDHWRKIAASACEQSGRIRPPLIDAPLPLKTWFASKTKDADIDLILKPGADTPITSLAAPGTKVCLLVGPEGGFSDSEHETAATAGFNAVSLGPRILRTETAALAALAVVQSLWGDLT